MTILSGNLIVKNNRRYIKIKYNQLLILDALLNDGGYKKKYIDKSTKVRYSEHSGLLGIYNNSIDRIIVNATTFREDDDDNDILLPNDLYDTYEYEYIFHTHPPTPKPGGRAKYGILYEFPSIYDIFHFIDHHNTGKTTGSIVVAPEGCYIIFSKVNNKILYDHEIENKLAELIDHKINIIQQKSIEKYGTNFSSNYFYNTIALDTTFLKMYNHIIKKYINNNLKIVIKHRIKHPKTGLWIINQLNLPI